MKQIARVITLWGFSCLLTTQAFADLNCRLQQVAAHLADQYDVHAISISAAVPNGRTYDVASGSMTKHGDEAVTPDSQYQVGGVTRTFTAALILQLQAEGKLKLSDTLGRYLPQYPKWQNITLKQLLTHTSGLYNYIDRSGWFFHLAFHPDQIWTLSDLADIAYAKAPQFEPGDGWGYISTDYVLLGLVIEKVSGHNMAQLITTRFIKPYHLTSTYYSDQAFTNAQLAKLVSGYYSWHNLTDINGSWIGPAGALVSTPADLVKWDLALFNGKVLKKAQLQQMLQLVSVANGQPLMDADNTGFGLGLFEVNTPAGLLYFAPGITPGYRSGFSYMPCTGLAVSFAMGSSMMDQPEIMGDLLTQSYQTLIADPSVQRAVTHYQKTHALPAFCQRLPAASQFSFPVLR